MAWTPREGTSIAVLLAAMEADRASHPVWSQTEAAKAMNVQRSMVPTYVAAACNAERLFRRTLVNGDGIELSLTRFPSLVPGSTPAAAPAAGDPRAPGPGGFIPAPMTAPRPGSDARLPKTAPGTPPAPIATRKPLCAGCTRSICWEKGCVAGKVADLIIPTFADGAAASLEEQAPAPHQLLRVVGNATPTAMVSEKRTARGERVLVVSEVPATGRAPEITIVPELREPGPLPAAEASIPEEGAGEEAEEETVEPDAFYSCRTGEIVLVGLEMDEDGRVTIPADLVLNIRRAVAWAPPPRGAL